MASSHFLRLSLVSCPILLYPATSDVHNAETGVVVDADEIVKGYKAGEGYIEITDEDIDAIEVESTRTINVDQFVPRTEMDALYIDRPSYIVPDAKSDQAFGVKRCWPVGRRTGPRKGARSVVEARR